MRIAFLHIAFETSPLIFHWRAELQSWRRRARERDGLARMSDGELHAIGVTSADRWAEINKPCSRGRFGAATPRAPVETDPKAISRTSDRRKGCR
jgi:uncharacterized protein YjiS (DUF1127 family)